MLDRIDRFFSEENGCCSAQDGRDHSYDSFIATFVILAAGTALLTCLMTVILLLTMPG